jgi:hypothetical protein
VNTDPRSSAQGTADILQEGTRRGVPVLIPGARESRMHRVDVLPEPHAARPAPGLAGSQAAVENARGRLESQREGGGAPSQRVHGGSNTRLSRVRRWFAGTAAVSTTPDPV